MSNLKDTLNSAMEIEGAIGVAVADHESGMCLGTAGGREGFDLEVAAAGNSEVVRAKLKVMAATGLAGNVLQDILISLDGYYHLIFPQPGSSLFVYMAFDRKQSNLALARHKLSQLLKDLQI